MVLRSKERKKNSREREKERRRRRTKRKRRDMERVGEDSIEGEKDRERKSEGGFGVAPPFL